ncbi:hypothetical protein S245_007870 [Arachis hypogaea]
MAVPCVRDFAIRRGSFLLWSDSPPTVMVDCLGPWMSCWGASGLCWTHFCVGLIQNKFYATKGTEAEPRKKGAAAAA